MTSDPKKYAPFGPFCLNENGIIKKLIDFLGGFITIDRNHREVHEGEFFEIGHTFIDVANNAYADLRFKTGAKQFHYGVMVIAEGKALGHEFRGTTYTADGTAVSVVNNSCASLNVSLVTAFHTPTIDIIGPDILTPENGVLIPGGSAGNSIGASVKANEERVARTNTDYLIRVQNVAGTAKDITILVGGYESSTVLE